MRRQTVALLGLSVVLVVALYFLFSLFLENTNIPYAYEIAAAFMGALVTVVITMVLLNRQSEVETLKERNVELLKQKIAVYAGLMDRLEAIMLKGEVSLEDEIGVQMLNLRLSLFASTDVLQKFNEFARQFSLVAADRKVTGKERAELMDVLGQLSTTIRHDLASNVQEMHIAQNRPEPRYVFGMMPSNRRCAMLAKTFGDPRALRMVLC